MAGFLLLIVFLLGLLLWPVLTRAITIPEENTSVYLESSSTIGLALVATSNVPTPTVQELVEQAFPDAPVMSRICDAESDCIPTAKNPNSSATGLFQILIGTWNAYACEGSRVAATSSIACARKIYDAEGTSPWNSSKGTWGLQ